MREVLCKIAEYFLIGYFPIDLTMPVMFAGMLRIDGIMTGRNRMFDTPGVPHDHQLSSRLTPDEVKIACNTLWSSTFRTIGVIQLLTILCRVAPFMQPLKRVIYLRTELEMLDLTSGIGPEEMSNQKGSLACLRGLDSKLSGVCQKVSINNLYLACR